MGQPGNRRLGTLLLFIVRLESAAKLLPTFSVSCSLRAYLCAILAQQKCWIAQDMRKQAIIAGAINRVNN